MSVKNFLERANGESVDAQQLCDFLVEHLSTLFVLYIRTGIDRNPFMTKGKQPSQHFVAAFTDREAVDQVRLNADYKIELVEEAALPFLLKTYRLNNQGVVLNPGSPSLYFIAKADVHQLITAYAVEQLSRMPGAWIPTMQQNMLLVEYQKNAFTVAIYANKEDAETMCQEAGGTAVMHQWKSIFERAQKVNAQSLYLHFHLPEQTYLSTQHIEKIWRGKHEGFEGHHSKTHPYQVQLIDAASAPVEEKSQRDAQPKTADPVEPTPKIDPVVQPVQHEPTNQVDQTETPANQSHEQVEQEEVDKSKKIERIVTKPVTRTKTKNARKLPSKRSNPYSIKNKNKQTTQFEIYRGSQEELAQEDNSLINQPVSMQSDRKPDADSSDQETASTVLNSVEDPIESSKATPLKTKSPVEPVKQQSPTPKTSPAQETVPSKDAIPSKKETVSQKANEGLSADVRQGLERLERATVAGQGMANGWEVCQVLAEIRRIWIIVDLGGNMVILAGQDQSPIVDFFTSDLQAQQLIAEAHKNNPNLPQMRPQLVSTRKLYRALSARQPIVWINRGSPGAWTSVMGDTLPYVMQLMAQYEQEKI